jgi:hypothetical protein
VLTRELVAIICLLGLIAALIFASYIRSTRVEKLIRQSEQKHI